MLEDLSARLPVDLSEAEQTLGCFTQNCIVVAEGELQANGVFKVGLGAWCESDVLVGCRLWWWHATPVAWGSHSTRVQRSACEVCTSLALTTLLAARWPRWACRRRSGAPTACRRCRGWTFLEGRCPTSGSCWSGRCGSCFWVHLPCCLWGLSFTRKGHAGWAAIHPMCRSLRPPPHSLCSVYPVQPAVRAGAAC